MIKEVRKLIVDILEDMEEIGVISLDLNLNKLDDADLKELHDNYIADDGYDVDTWIKYFQPEVELAYKQFIIQ